MATDKRWKPVRDGGIYCSPACGHKCTYADYKQAKANANALAQELGEGWKPYVRENGGWFYEANSTKCKATVRLAFDSGYVADIYVSGIQFYVHGSTPKSALKKALAKMRIVAGRIEKDLCKLGGGVT